MKKFFSAMVFSSRTAKVRATTTILAIGITACVSYKPEMFALIPRFVGLWWEQPAGTVPFQDWVWMVGFPFFLLVVYGLSVGLYARSYGVNGLVTGIGWPIVVLWCLLRGTDHIYSQQAWLLLFSVVALTVILIWRRLHHSKPPRRHHGRSSFPHCDPGV